LIVVDCTVVSDHLFGDSAARGAMDLLMELDPEWISVVLVAYEVGNVASKYCRFGKLSEDAACQALAKVPRLLAEMERDIDGEAALRIAVGTGLTFYDASYIWLARARGVKLWTRDKQVLRECQDVAVAMPVV